MTDSQQLLAQWVGNYSEEAFRELVARYVDLVYSTGLRLVEGDSHRAEDVTQMVFADLARHAHTLPPNTMLGGWLHRHTCFVARNFMRGERRRIARERQAMELSALDRQHEAALAEIAPVVDEAINQLAPDDRDAILLRYFERLNLRAVGEALGISENVAQKRVARALQELAGLLRKRGVTSSASVLGAVLAAEAVRASPVGLALVTAKAALAKSGSGGLTAASAKAAAVSKVKTAVAGALVVATIATTVLLLNSSKKPRDASQPAQQEMAEQQVSEDQVNTTPPPAPASDVASNILTSEAPKVENTSAPVSASFSPANPLASTTRPANISASGVRLQRFGAKPGSWIRLSGTSTLGNWQAQSRLIGGFAELAIDPPAPLEPGLIQGHAEAFIPVRSFTSVKPDGSPYSTAMDDAMYESLKASTHPRIVFLLTDLILHAPAQSNGAPRQCEAIGELAVAGVTNPIALPVRLWPLAENRLRISGACKLAMTAFGINPPVSPLAADLVIRTADEVNLEFEWVVAPQATSLSQTRKSHYQDKVPLLLDLPKAAFKGGPRDLPQGLHLEPVSNTPRPPMLVPPGLMNLAREATITCSDRNLSPHDMAKIVDGDKEAADQSIIYLRKGTQWVQLDLGRPAEVFAVAVWHAHNSRKVYHDVVVRIADDPSFSRNAKTLFNNDRDNTSSLGAGVNLEYLETCEGKLIDARGAKGRYLRFYSRGSTDSALNEYTEIEVYGRTAS